MKMQPCPHCNDREPVWAMWQNRLKKWGTCGCDLPCEIWCDGPWAEGSDFLDFLRRAASHSVWVCSKCHEAVS